MAENASMSLGQVVEIDFGRNNNGWADLPTRNPPPGTAITIPVSPGLITLEESVRATWRLVDK